MSEQRSPSTFGAAVAFPSRKGLLLIVSFCFLLAFPLFFLRGIGVTDDSLYLKIGEMIADGAVPYRDVWENKTPGVYYLAALLAVVGDRHWLAPRLFLFLFGLGFSLGTIIFTWRTYGPAAAHWTAWIFPLSYVTTQGYSLHTDHGCALFGFAALVLLCGERRQSAAAWLGAGLFVGLAFLFKQYATFYILGLALSLLLWAVVGHISWRAAVLHGLVLVGGFAAVLLASAGLAWWFGIWAESYDAVIGNALIFATLPVYLHAAVNVWLMLPAVPLTVLAVLVLLGSRRVRQTLRKHPLGAQLSMFAVTGVVALIPTLRLSGATGHYGCVAMVPLTIFSAAVLSAWAEGLPSLAPRLAGVLPALLLSPYFLALLYGDWVMISQDRLRIDLRQQRELRAVLDVHVAPTERILCLSPWRTPRLYYMSSRWPVRPYLYFAFNLEDRFSFADAVRLLFERKVRTAVVEVPDNAPNDGSPVLRADDLQRLRAGYEVVELEHGHDPVNHVSIYVLVRRSAIDSALEDARTSYGREGPLGKQ